MKRKKWLVVLSLTSILTVSGAAWAYASGGAFNSSQRVNGLNWTVYRSRPVIQVDASQVQNPQIQDNSTSPSESNNGPFGYGYGMMGGYGAYENGNNGGNNGYGFGGNGGFGYGMMGGRFNANSGLSVKDGKSAASDMTASLSNAAIDKSSNTITYTGNDIKIVMLGGPENADEKFVIGGLVNPTLQVPKGANVTMELINEDEGMPHGVEITPASPPYNYMLMMDGGIYPGTFVPPIPEADKGQYTVAQTSFVTNGTGTFYYICQYPGHAQKGMYGKILIQ